MPKFVFFKEKWSLYTNFVGSHVAYFVELNKTTVDGKKSGVWAAKRAMWGGERRSASSFPLTRFHIIGMRLKISILRIEFDVSMKIAFLKDLNQGLLGLSVPERFLLLPSSPAQWALNGGNSVLLWSFFKTIWGIHC